MKGTFLPLTTDNDILNNDIKKSLTDIDNIKYYSSKEDKNNLREDVSALYFDLNKSKDSIISEMQIQL